MPAGNVMNRRAGLATGQSQVLGFGLDTAIDRHTYDAPGSKIFYVDPNNPQAVDLGNLGEDPTIPLATIQAAIALCRPYMGDTIVVGANDAWQYAAGVRNVAIAESVVIPANKGGITITAAATNPMACVWRPAAANGIACRVLATDVLIEGFCFYAGILAGCTAIQAEWTAPTLYGENLTVRNCYFDTGLDYGVRLDYAWYCQIYGNHFNGVNIAAIQSMDVAGDADFCNIHDNEFINCTAAIDLEDVDGCFIQNNRIYGDSAGVNNFIDLTGGADCLVGDNFLACTIAEYDVTCSDATSGAWINNHCTNGDTTAPPV